jgi:hypothetical protein
LFSYISVKLYDNKPGSHQHAQKIKMLRKPASTHIIKNMPVYWESYIRGCSKALTRTIIDCALDHHNIDIACIQETKLRTPIRLHGSFTRISRNCNHNFKKSKLHLKSFWTHALLIINVHLPTPGAKTAPYQFSRLGSLITQLGLEEEKMNNSKQIRRVLRHQKRNINITNRPHSSTDRIKNIHKKHVFHILEPED